MLSNFSCAYWPSVCLLCRNVYLQNKNPLFGWIFCCWFIEAVCKILHFLELEKIFEIISLPRPPLITQRRKEILWLKVAQWCCCQLAPFIAVKLHDRMTVRVVYQTGYGLLLWVCQLWHFLCPSKVRFTLFNSSVTTSTTVSLIGGSE